MGNVRKSQSFLCRNSKVSNLESILKMRTETNQPAKLSRTGTVLLKHIKFKLLLLCITQFMLLLFPWVFYERFYKPALIVNLSLNISLIYLHLKMTRKMFHKMSNLYWKTNQSEKQQVTLFNKLMHTKWSTLFLEN